MTAGACNTITKVDPQGDVLWGKATVEGSNQSTSLVLEADKGLVLGGWISAASTGTIATVSKYDSNGNSCKDTSNITYTVSEIEMLSNAVLHNGALRSIDSEEIPVFSDPILSVEKVCGMAAPPAFLPGIKANGQVTPVNIGHSDSVKFRSV